MPRIRRDPTGPIKDWLMEALDGRVSPSGLPGDEPEDGVAFYDVQPGGDDRIEAGKPYGTFGPFYFQSDRFGSSVTGQLDFWSQATSSVQADRMKARAIEIVAMLEGEALAAASGDPFSVTQVEFIPSPTLDERGQHGDATFHGVVRFTCDVFDPQAG